MAKTVFGVPGIGDKSRETAGDAVAPGGTPGAQPREKMPQKSGKELSSPSSAEVAAPDKPETPKPVAPTDKPEVPKTPAPIDTPEAKKPAGGPVMAKPMAPPMAKPASPAKAPVPGAGGGKTMFGMPAMKLPEQQPGRAPTEPADAPWADGQDSAEPDAKVEPKEGDAYKATVLGVAAVDLSGGLDASEEEQVPPEIEKTVSMPEIAEASTIKPPETGAAPREFSSAARGSARFPDNVGSGKSSSAVVLAIILLFVALIAIVYYLFGSPDESDVTEKAPAPPAQAVPVVPVAPTAPNPEAAQ
ncbi:MAG: hypothetical protein GY762_14020 [Proteobacteria bacterium]|nr:hypothetical protein [Pseudomonadota bacterium]